MAVCQEKGKTSNIIRLYSPALPKFAGMWSQNFQSGWKKVTILPFPGWKKNSFCKKKAEFFNSLLLATL